MKRIFLVVSIFSVVNVQICIGSDIKGTVGTIYGPLQNAVVYIGKIEGKTFQLPKEPAILSQRNLTFIPHILPVLKGTIVIFPNNDNIRHNVFSPSKIKKFDLGTYPPDSKKELVFDKPGVVMLLCHVHHEMSAFIIVLETPYFAVTDSKGDFTIKDVPPGKYKLTMWHEEKKSISKEIVVQESGNITVDYLIK